MKVITRQYPRETEYLTLYPIADVHWGAAECMEREFQAYLRKIQEDESAAVLLAGYPERTQMRPTAFYPDTIRLDGTKKAWA